MANKNNKSETLIGTISRDKAVLTLFEDVDGKYRFHIHYKNGRDENDSGSGGYALLLNAGLDGIIQMHNVIKTYR